MPNEPPTFGVTTRTLSCFTPRMSASWLRCAKTPWPWQVSVNRPPSYLHSAERGSIAATTTLVFLNASLVTWAALAKAAATFSGSPQRKSSCTFPGTSS